MVFKKVVKATTSNFSKVADESEDKYIISICPAVNNEKIY